MTRLLRFLAALVLCGVALLLPYRARLAYGNLLARLAHAPFLLFGFLARAMLTRLGMDAFPGGAARERR